jgi:hypothetical protein
VRFIRSLLFLLLACLLVAGEHSAQARVRTQQYSVPTPNSGPYGIVAGPDGALWFTEYLGNKVGRISLPGMITESPEFAHDIDLASITTGPDGPSGSPSKPATRSGSSISAEGPELIARPRGRGDS